MATAPGWHQGWSRSLVTPVYGRAPCWAERPVDIRGRPVGCCARLEDGRRRPVVHCARLLLCTPGWLQRPVEGIRSSLSCLATFWGPPCFCVVFQGWTRLFTIPIHFWKAWGCEFRERGTIFIDSRNLQNMSFICESNCARAYIVVPMGGFAKS